MPIRSLARCLLLTAVCVLPALTPNGALADIYSFVDHDGVAHYTNMQPSGAGWKRVYRTEDKSTGMAGGRRASSYDSVSRVDGERLRRYDPHILEAAQLYQLPQAFIRAIVLVESNFYPDAVSQTGAVGLMQLMPGTAASMGVLDPFDPRQNVLGGTRFLRVLANHFAGDLVLTVAAYNAGEGAVTKYRGVPPYDETRRYVRKVLHHYYEFRNETVVAKR